VTVAQPTGGDDRPPTDQHLELRVAVPGGMTEGAVDHFRRCVHEFTVDLSREASRLEEAVRAKGVPRPEITTTMVVNANEAVRNPLSSQGTTPNTVLIAQSVAFTAGILTPISGAYLHSVLQ